MRHGECAVGTTVVDDNILPVGVFLRNNTLDTFAKIWLAVVNGSHDAYKWLAIHWHFGLLEVLVKSQLAFFG